MSARTHAPCPGFIHASPLSPPTVGNCWTRECPSSPKKAAQWFQKAPDLPPSIAIDCVTSGRFNFCNPSFLSCVCTHIRHFPKPTLYINSNAYNSSWYISDLEMLALTIITVNPANNRTRELPFIYLFNRYLLSIAMWLAWLRPWGCIWE